MKYKKFKIIIPLLIFLITNINSVFAYNQSKEDKVPPTINKVIPNECEQYIVGKPKIVVKFNDLNGIDLSSIKLYVNYSDVTSECHITDNKITYKPKSKFKRGNQIAKIELCDLSSNKNKTEFEWYFTVGTPIYSHYRGLLHSHTSNSDGHGTYEDAYYLAKYKANLDFFAITEHSNYLDNDLKCNLDNAQLSNKWNEVINCSNKFNVDGEFVSLYGFEMTYSHKDKNPIGHINIFNTNGFVSTNDKSLKLNNFYNLISSYDNVIGQFNHPGSKFGTFENLKYSPNADNVMYLLEVDNGYNSDISKNIRSHDYYQIALDNGWHIAPSANQDNHRVDFGIANELRTVILSTDLTKDALYDGIRNLRVYATEDKNIKIDYNINESTLGSTIINPSKLNFSISIIDTDLDDVIKEIQVISNKGKIIKQESFNSNLARLDFTLDNTKEAFYYVKVFQNNNKISVTAPIWIKNR